MEEGSAFFEISVRPHRSLSRRGLWTLIGFIMAASMTISTGLFLAGAWPVAGFSGVEIVLAVVLLRINARRARRREVIMLAPRMARVVRTDERGRESERRLTSAWLNVVLEERLARVPGLFLRARGDQEEVGREIGEAEKRALADALAGALYQWRHPSFDNPQLRDG